MRITVRGKRTEISVGRDCEPDKWNSSAGRGAGTKESVRTLNDYLDTLAHKVRIAHQLLLDKGISITAESLRKQYTGELEVQYYLIKLLMEHNSNVEALIGNGFEANTLKGYKTSEKHLKGYLQTKYGKTDIEITQLNHAFITGFEFI